MFSNLILVAAPTTITAIVIVIILILVLGAIASGAELGFFSFKVKDLNYLKTKDDNNSRLIVSILEEPELLQASLRVSKFSLSLLSIFGLIYVTQLTAPAEVSPILVYGGLAIACMLILTVFVEVLPKIYAKHNYTRMAAFTIPVVNLLFLTFKGFGQMLIDSEQAKELKRDRHKSELQNLKELESAIEASLGHAASKEEVDIFRGVLKFGSITVKQIMQPRLEVSAIRESWDTRKVKQKISDAGYSRFPVYRNNIDEVVGMIHSKDLLPFLEIDDFDWHSLFRPAYYVHQHKLIDDLLNEFREHRVHFAIVVDEFGGTSGVVTLEDIMEEIVGDIKDEFDEEEHNFRKLDDQTYIFEGRMLINDMCRILGVPLSTFALVRGESDSVAGLVLEIAGKFPTVNEQVSHELFDFTILSVDKLRIEKVKVEYHLD